MTVIDDLTKKIVIDKYCTLTSLQTVLYESKPSHTLVAIKCVKHEYRSSRGLSPIQDLKQICNARLIFFKEELYLDAKYSGKMEVLFELHDEMRKKCLIFT